MTLQSRDLLSLLLLRVALLLPGKTVERNVSIKASLSGTKLLMATFSHSGSQATVSRSFHKVSVAAD